MHESQRNLVILLVTLVVIMLGFGMVIPIVPFYIDSFGTGGRELGWLMVTFASMQFLPVPGLDGPRNKVRVAGTSI